MKRILAVLTLLVLCLSLTGQSVYDSSRHHYWVGVVPGTSTVVIAGSVQVIGAVFTTGVSSGTITMTDRGTDCSAGPCHFANATPIAAATIYAIPIEGQYAPNGIAISATGTVEAHIHWVTLLP